MQGQSFATCPRTKASQFWQAIQLGARVQVGSGSDTLFWLDLWLGDRLLHDQFPALFSIASQQDISVASAILIVWGTSRSVAHWDLPSWRSGPAKLGGLTDLSLSNWPNVTM